MAKRLILAINPGSTSTKFGLFEEENLVFINAWNEWGEGNHLEPDLKHGHGYLEATRQALIS